MPQLKAEAKFNLVLKFKKTCIVAPDLVKFHIMHQGLTSACVCVCVKNILRDERESGTRTVQRYRFSMGQGGGEEGCG